MQAIGRNEYSIVYYTVTVCKKCLSWLETRVCILTLCLKFNSSANKVADPSRPVFKSEVLKKKESCFIVGF